MKETHPCLRVWGECKFGPSCQFINAAYDLCLHFAKGYCSEGDYCTFSHDPTWGIPTYTAAANAPTTRASPPPICVHWQAGHCRNGASCAFGHPQPATRKEPPPKAVSASTEGRSSAPCKFFLQGGCTKGLQCSFTHPEIAEKDLIRPDANGKVAKKARLEDLKKASNASPAAASKDPVEVYLAAHSDPTGTVVVSRPEELRGKLHRLRALALQGRVRFLVDFDQTITTYAGQGLHGRNPTCSHLMEMCYDDENRAKAKEYLNKYYPKEIDPTLTMAEKIRWMEEWVKMSNSVTIAANLTLQQVHQKLSEATVRIRDKFQDFLLFARGHRFPVLVFSAGISEIVSEVFRMRLSPSLLDSVEVFANKFALDADGRIVGYVEPHHHVFNKRLSAYYRYRQPRTVPEAGDWILDAAGEDDLERQKQWGIICIGDSLGDADIVDIPVAECIKIGFLNTSPETRMEEFKQKFDIVITGDGDFQPILDVCYVGCDVS